MKLYKIGKIVSVGKTYVILEANNTGQIIYVPNPSEFKKDRERKMFIYEHRNEYTNSTYGFGTFRERILFEDLLAVSGVGPKTALSILKNGSEYAVSLIAAGQHEELSKLPLVNSRSAKQIMLELSEKYSAISKKSNKNIVVPNKEIVDEVRSALKMLGFKKAQIDYGVSSISEYKSAEQAVESAIMAISNGKQVQAK